MDGLVAELVSGQRVLFITGAGLSAASGITPYRGSKNAIWKKFLLSWGTRKKFKRNPKLWWNEFWLRSHETPMFLTAAPNAGHYAIASICQRSSSRVITQNIDNLHLKTPLVKEKLIEVHGRLGLYKCIKENCKYSWEESIEKLDLDALAADGTRMEAGNLRLATAPICPLCHTPCLPQSLFFDEQYASHSFYQYQKAQEWLLIAEVFVFVGTSFSVGVTQEALQIAKEYNKRVYNFNLYKEDHHGCYIDYFEASYDNSSGRSLLKMAEMVHIIGPAERTLPLLLQRLCDATSPRLRLWFTPPQCPEERQWLQRIARNLQRIPPPPFPAAEPAISTATATQKAPSSHRTAATHGYNAPAGRPRRRGRPPGRRRNNGGHVPERVEVGTVDSMDVDVDIEGDGDEDEEAAASADQWNTYVSIMDSDSDGDGDSGSDFEV